MFKTRNGEITKKRKLKNISAPTNVVIVARFILFGDRALNFCVQGNGGGGGGGGGDTFFFFREM